MRVGNELGNIVCLPGSVKGSLEVHDLEFKMSQSDGLVFFFCRLRVGGKLALTQTRVLASE